jgi:hypothetical protein
VVVVVVELVDVVVLLDVLDVGRGRVEPGNSTVVVVVEGRGARVIVVEGWGSVLEVVVGRVVVQAPVPFRRHRRIHARLHTAYRMPAVAQLAIVS